MKLKRKHKTGTSYKICFNLIFSLAGNPYTIRYIFISTVKVLVLPICGKSVLIKNVSKMGRTLASY